MKDVSDQVPGLSNAERAFELTEGKHAGERVKVKITRRETDGPDPGVGEARFLRMKVQAFLLDADGAVQVQEGTPVQTAAFGRTLRVSAIDEGQISIPNELGEATREAVRRIKKHLTAMEAWDAIPSEG